MRKAVPKRKRERWVLEAIASFVEELGWWPTTQDLCAFTGRGHRNAWLDYLNAGSEYGIVARASGIRWVLTAKGCAVIGRLPIVATKPAKRWCYRNRGKGKVAKRKRVDAYSVFERERRPWAGDELEVIE
jgi:hypothetical protein